MTNEQIREGNATDNVMAQSDKKIHSNIFRYNFETEIMAKLDKINNKSLLYLA